MNAQDQQAIQFASDTVGAAVGRNITNPTPLDRLIALAYPNRRIQRDYFQFGCNFLGLATGTTQTGQVTIAADSDFVLLMQNAWVGITAATSPTVSTEVVPNVNVMLTDTSSGRQLFDIPQPLSNMFGQARRPFVLPLPRLFPAKTLLQIAVSNFDTTSSFDLRFSFIGVKVFDLGPAS